MRRLVFLLLLLLISPSAALQIVEFCPDPYLPVILMNTWFSKDMEALMV